MTNHLSSSDLARALSARRPKIKGTCVRCGKSFEGLRTRQYCSNTCAAAAYRERHKEELAERRRKRYREKKKGG